MDKKRILIAEDEKAIAKALSLKLESAGYETKVAYNGQEAIDELKAGQYDLMFMDLIMPKTDGFSVLEQMQEQDIKVPVIVLSNLSQENDLEKAKKLGAKDYFIKSDTPLAEIVDYARKIIGK